MTSNYMIDENLIWSVPKTCYISLV